MHTAKARRAGCARVSWKKIAGHSDMNHQQGIDWSDSIELLRKLFEGVPLKHRDPRIEEALQEVEAQPPSRQHLIEYMISNFRMGFFGPEVSQDILCETIRRVTHTKRFGKTTLRASVKWAIEAGFLTQSWIPIGTKFELPTGDFRTKRIRRYTGTYRLRLLVSILRINPKNYRPKLEIIDDNLTQGAQEPTLSESGDNPNGEQPEDSSKSSGMLLRQSQFEDVAVYDETRRFPGVEVSAPPVADESTKPDRSGPTVKQQSSTLSGSSKPRRKRPKKRAVRFQRRNRATIPTTYRDARRQLLHELWVYLKPDTEGALENAFDLYRIAELQTDPYYPQGLPDALDWYDRLISSYCENWHERRRIIERIVVPALRAFADDWTPPEKTDDPQYQTVFDDWERRICPEPGIAVRPSNLPEFFRLWPHVRAILSAIHAGAMPFESNAIQKRQNLIFQFCRLFLSCR